MPISDKYKLIFIHVPKNAGTAITDTLQMYDIGHHGWQYYKNKYPQKWDIYTKVSITRNPWDRAVSCYEYAKMDNSYWHSKDGKSKAGKHLDYDLLKEKSFEECLEILEKTPHLLKHQGWGDQSNYVYNGNQLMVDHILDINNINSELSKILKTEINIPKINVSNENNYTTYYKNQKMIDLINEYYKRDILNFNYRYE